MKIYFTASITHFDQFGKVYRTIVDHLEKQGHEVFTTVLSRHLPENHDVSQKKLTDWYKEWTVFTRECDAVFVEGSHPSSLHVGFEAGLLLSRGKPVVLLHQHGYDPIFINPFHSKRLIKSEYDLQSLPEVLDWTLDEVESISNRRFTFFISPEIDEYLTQVVKKKGLSRSEFIRILIEGEMQEED